MKRIFTLLILLIPFVIVQAQIPNIIPYQGSISDTSGEGFDGNFQPIQFQVSIGNKVYTLLPLNLEIFQQQQGF